ncbi:DMT family transporter [Parachlamydia sp. AcF125]|uniref:DMT family transporter n=1 Tax=Parachlamydia sp. AcF125 TaxID=2795736 RepID=UPI001BC97B3E|nr:DMT family transporter [Parachlamydia sp. AcF125]MBS4167734.1 S-adenosylmethionine/S-adenosylhomocysteine transporter [Parachlamydia sp. AcF125]
MYVVILLYALFASVFTICKMGLQYAQPFFFVGTRMLCAGTLMLSYQYFRARDQFSISKKDLILFGALGFFSIYLTNILEFWGLKYLTSFKTCFIYSLSPFVSALLSYLLFAERMTGKKWLGLLIGFTGFIPILLTTTQEEELTGHFFILSWAEIAVIVAAISSVYGWILLKQLVADRGYSPLMANGLSMVIGGSFALLHSWTVESWNPAPFTEFLPFLGCTILLIIVSNLICYNLYGLLLRKYSPTFMSFAGFTTPFFTALFGWLYLGETVSLPFFASAGIVLVGLLVFYLEELKKPLAVRSTEPSAKIL